LSTCLRARSPPSTAAAKDLVNQVSLPSADRLLNALNSFQTALTWPEARRRIQALLERGLQRDPDFEKRWLAALGTLLEGRCLTSSVYMRGKPRSVVSARQWKH
jgi:hypothetical protein